MLVLVLVLLVLVPVLVLVFVLVLGASTSAGGIHWVTHALLAATPAAALAGQS